MFANVMALLQKELDTVINSLIVSLIMFGAEVWECARAAHTCSKYLVHVIQINQLLSQAFRFRDVQKRKSICSGI